MKLEDIERLLNTADIVATCQHTKYVGYYSVTYRLPGIRITGNCPSETPEIEVKDKCFLDACIKLQTLLNNQ